MFASNLKTTTLYLKLILISVLLFSTALIMLYMNNSTKNKFDELINNQHNYNAMAVQGYLEHSKDEYLKFINAFFDNQNIKYHIESKDRENFYKNIVPFYNKYKTVDSSLWGVHIVLSDGMSFIRVHSPQTPDTYIGNNKALMKKTLKTQRVQSGFEVGKYGYFYRVVYPIFIDGKFLGISEFSYKIDKIIDDLYEHYKFNIAFVFKENSQKKELIDYSKQSKDGYIVQYTRPKILLEDISQISISDNKERVFQNVDNIFDIHVYDLPDLQNDSKLVTFYNITSLIKERETTLFQLFTILLFISLILIVFVIFIIDFFSKKVRLKEAESSAKTRELYFKSRHNNLTKLPNKSMMSEDVRLHEAYSVLMLNVDNISIFNTTYGADIVDIVLKEVASYLQSNIPSNGILYHMSADEFTIILNEPTDNQDILLSAQIKAYFEQSPIYAKNIKTHVNFSIGIASHKPNQHSNSKLNVYEKANIALVEAKHRGKGLILKFDESMSSYGSYTQLAKNITILQRDLEDENLTPFYQPIVDTYTKDIIKYEVLARIKDDTGFISPHEFLEAAEISGLQTVITKQIIQKSFQYFSSTTIAFSINITKHDLLEKYLADFLDAKSKKHNIDPKNVTLEILEDIAIDNDDEIIAQINHLNSLGYVIAIDDFGVESSNISKLADLNADFIKIDGSFIKDMDRNEKHLRIVESLVYMAKKLDMKIVAEYVHNEEIYEIVKSLGIQYSQGYYFSEPKKSI